MVNPTDIPGATLDLNFMIPGSLPAGLTFTRSTTGTYLDINGLLQTAAIDTPRWDYDPVARALKGLLIEDARTNQFTQSGNFQDAAWSKNFLTFNTAAPPGPAGAVTGLGFITSSTTTGYVSQNKSVTAGAAITLSCFFKAEASPNAVLLFSGTPWSDATNRSATFNLLTGTVNVLGGGATAGIVPVGNGWYRCHLTATPELSVTTGPQIRAVGLGDNVTTQFWAFGAQIEVGAFATSYIPTTTAAVTRAMEVCQMPTAPWFVSGVPASFATDVIFQGTGANPTSRTVFQADDNTASNRYLQYNPANTVTILGHIFAGGASGVAPTATTSIPYGSVMKLSASFTGTSNSQCANGGLVDITTHTLGFPLGVTTLRIGSQIAASHMGGWMRRHTYWPRALTNLELQKVTAPEPVGSPALTLDFMTPNVLPTGVVFTRASTGTYLDIDGLLQTAAINAPRWDYNPATRMLKGVLFEDARTNAALQSGDFTNAAWVKNLTTLDTTPMLGPNGPATGVGLITDAGVTGYLTQSIQFTAGVTITWSCFLKAATSPTATLLLDRLSWNDAINRTAVFDLATGQVSSTTGGGAVASIYPAGNGWYRCAIRATPDLTALRGPQIRASSSGDGVSTQFWAWGAQHEIGSVMTSYIPTTTTNIARSADICSITPAGWFNAGTGTMFFESDVTAPTGVIGGFVGSSFNDSFYISVGSSGPNAIIAGVSKTAPAGVISTTGIMQKAVASYSTGRLAASNNGGAVATNATLAASPYPWTTSFVVGSAPWGPGTSSIMGHARRATYWPRALTDAEMIAETGDAYRMQATVAS